MITENELNNFKNCADNFPKKWDGKECIFELKKNGYQWKQMEWGGFWFEFKCKRLLKEFNSFYIPGDKFGNVEFDFRGKFNWDIKNHSINAGNRIILNDKNAIIESIKKYQYHGFLISDCDFKYDDTGEFKIWHDKLKGKKSKYQIKSEKLKKKSRMRKLSAKLIKITLYVLSENSLKDLTVHNQGKNSNDSKRKPKYALDTNKLENIYNEVIYEG
tara:strand:- start:802 stop:1449 length:648 start_codon:yes stop_codon:yes gene_type:complete